MKKSIWERQGLTSTLAIIASLTYLGQNNPSFAAEVDKATTKVGFEEIVVSARKREETLQNVPVSVTAFSGEGLENRGISNLQGINNFTPNLELSNGRPDGGGSAAQAYIRGIGQSDFLFPNDPGVGLYIDDVYLARSVGGMMALVDVERVEVLRGPQGTLYGKNTIGGAIKIVTKKPTGELGGKVKLEVGNFDKINGSFSLNFPLSEKIYGRVQAGTLNQDGYVTRIADGIDLGNVNKDLFRADFVIEANDDLTILLAGDIQRQRQNGAPGTLLTIVDSTAGAAPLLDGGGNPIHNPVTNQPAVVPGSGLIEGLYNPVIVPLLWVPALGLPAGSAFDARWITGNAFSTNGTAPAVDNNDIWGLSMTLDWTLGEALSLKSISSYRKIKATFSRDGDHSPLPIVSTYNKFKQSQFSQEIQLSGVSFDGKLNWLAGIYGFNEKASDDNDVKLVSGTFDIIGLELDLTPLSDIKVNSLAGFFHGTYDVTEKLSVTAGLRYTYDKKELSRTFLNTRSGFVITMREEGVAEADNGRFGPPLEESWSEFSPKFGVDYQATEDLLLYALYSRGFKSGGWSPRPQVGTENDPYEPEILNSFEVGSKSKWYDDRLIANFSAFFNKYKNIQITTVQADPGGMLILPVENAGEAELYGFELEVKVMPTPELQIHMGLGYLHNEYTELDLTSGIMMSNKLADAPELTFNGSVQYVIPVGDNGEISLRGGAAYKSKTYKDPFNTVPLTQPGYWLFDAGISYETLDGDWRIALVGTNLADKKYLSNGVDVSAFGYFEGYFGRPREYSLSITRNF
ncbi:MAG: TonB-dependent receptor [Emcibacter sp.]|nr:TonB-dependent receptor [Emcibacter sp.]